MSFIAKIKIKAQQNPQKIVLPEATDPRILKAAAICQQEKIAQIILIGQESLIKQVALQENINIEGLNIIDPQTSNLTAQLTQDLYDLRKEKGLTLEQAEQLITTDYMYFACMLVKDNYAAGAVSGACHSTSNTLKPALQIIKAAPNVPLVSSFFLMEVPNCSYGYNGLFVFSDAGLVQNPSAIQLAAIAASSSASFELLTNQKAVTALLSHSTKGSASHPDIDKVVEATQIAQKEYPNYMIDGELQLDAAIDPLVAKIKAPNSAVAGHANTLIFPDLDAGNIGYKLVERLAKAESYGPITQGINKPINDLSRGCSVEDIVGVIAITCLQAIQQNSV